MPDLPVTATATLPHIPGCFPLPLGPVAKGEIDRAFLRPATNQQANGLPSVTEQQPKVVQGEPVSIPTVDAYDHVLRLDPSPRSGTVQVHRMHHGVASDVEDVQAT